MPVSTKLHPSRTPSTSSPNRRKAGKVADNSRLQKVSRDLDKFLDGVSRSQGTSPFGLLGGLVERAQKGDHQAREDLFSQCDANVRRWARAEVGEDRADDLRQEVLMRAHRKLKSLEVPEAFLGWLRVMTRRLAYNLLKRERPERRWWASAANDRSLDIFELIPGRESDPALEYLEEADRQACLEIIWQVVSRLEPRQRLLAELYYREGRSITQIAHRLGTQRKPLPEGTVKTHLNRLRKIIRKEVLGLGGQGEPPHAPMLA